MARRFAEWYGGILVGLILECVFFASVSESFRTFSNAINVWNQVTYVAIIAVGMTFVIIAAGIDLSVGSLVAASGVVAAKVLTIHGVPWQMLVPLAVLSGMLLGTASGALAGLMITRFRVTPFIATLAMMSSLRGLAFIFCSGLPIGNLPEVFGFLGRQRVLEFVPVRVIVMAIILISGIVVLRKTRFGRYVYAIGGNEEAARLSGIATMRVKWLVYVMSGTLAALAGVILASSLGAGVPQAGEMWELDVIAAVVVGGTSLMGGVGTIEGTFIGAMIIQVLENGLNHLGVSSHWQRVALGAVILGAVLLDQMKKRRA